MTNPKTPTGAGEQTQKAAADGDVGGQAGDLLNKEYDAACRRFHLACRAVEIATNNQDAARRECVRLEHLMGIDDA